MKKSLIKRKHKFSLTSTTRIIGICVLAGASLALVALVIIMIVLASPPAPNDTPDPSDTPTQAPTQAPTDPTAPPTQAPTQAPPSCKNKSDWTPDGSVGTCEKVFSLLRSNDPEGGTDCKSIKDTLLCGGGTDAKEYLENRTPPVNGVIAGIIANGIKSCCEWK